MTEEDKAQMFQQYVPMVGALARKYDSKKGWVYQNIYDAGVGWLSLTAAMWDTEENKYDPSKCQQSTWIWRGIRYKMLDWMRDTDRKIRRTVDINNPNVECILPFDVPSLRERLMQTMAQLSSEAGLVMRLVLAGPSEMLEELVKATKGRGNRRDRGREVLKRHLQYQEGWTEEKVDRAFDEVEASLCTKG